MASTRGYQEVPGKEPTNGLSKKFSLFDGDEKLHFSSGFFTKSKEFYAERKGEIDE